MELGAFAPGSRWSIREKSMRKHLSTIILGIIFLVGLSVLLYPTVANYVNSRSQSRAIASYIDAMTQVDPDLYKEEMEAANAYNVSLLTNDNRFSPPEEELEVYKHYLGADNSAIGYVEIRSIGVTLPMYLGTDEAILQAGIGCMPGSSLPVGGESTHAVLTGHRGLPSSKLLTDLDQVDVGDIFTIVVLNDVLTYQVDQIKIVLPHEMEDLAIVEGEDYCTLVTCTPYGINSHRMLVRGHRVDNSMIDAVAARVTADAIQVDTLIVTPIVAIPMLIAFVVILSLKGKKSRK